MEEKKKWTVFFLMHAVENFYEEAICAIRSILASDRSDQIGVAFCLNINTKNLPSDFETGDPRKPDRVTTLFYVLGRDSKGKNKLAFLSESSDFRFTDPQSVRTFFTDTVMRFNGAERFLLVTWDHGRPFGLFPNTDDGGSSDPLPAHGSLLTIRELRQAIEFAFGNQKIDVVVMFNCYLQYFDTGFELSSCVDYLAAFETHMIFDDNLDYSGIIKSLSADPRIEPKDVVKLFVTKFEQSKDPGPATKNQVVFSAHDLNLYPAMANLIDELAHRLIQLLPTHKKKIGVAIGKCRYLVNSMIQFRLIDFGNFVKQLHNELPEAFPGELYARINTMIDQIVLKRFIGRNFENEQEPPFYSPVSFSIYLPDTLGATTTMFFEIFVDFRSSEASSFATGFQWVPFIMKFTGVPF